MTDFVYPCPVCGYLTFGEPPGSYAICAVCGWEDDALQLEFATTLDGGANAMTVAEAQRLVASGHPTWSGHRPVTARPERDPSWRPIDPTRDRFPRWDDPQRRRAPGADERLYYWRPTFWHRDPAS